MRYQKTAFVILLGLSVVSCGRIYGEKGLIKKRSQEYKQSQEVEQLTVPKELSANVKETYAIPQTKQDNQEEASLLPPGSVAPQIEQGEIEVKPIKQGKLKSDEITITKDKDGDTYMQVTRPTEFVWYLMGEAIEPAGYRIASQDQLIYSYFILDIPKTGGVVRKDTPLYQFQLFTMDDRTGVYLLDEAGEPLPSAVAEPVFNNIREAILHPKRPNWFSNFMKKYFGE